MSSISIEGVSKRFRLYHERPASLKERVVRRARSRFDDLWALRDISLEVEPGSSFGLIGHNGSGKSTLLKLMAGVYQPTSGIITADGRIAALIELGAGFHPELTGRENVYLNGSIMGLSNKEIDKRFDSIVEFSGLADFIDNPVKIYSSGMYVRLGFSVAVNVRPDILLVDEVIAVGDEEFQRRCMDHIYSLKKEGCTIVFVSHSLATIESLCERAAWLDHGELQASGEAGHVCDLYLTKVNEQERADRAKAEPEVGIGGGPVRITSVELVNDEGAVVPMVATGDPITIRIWFHADDPIPDPVVGIALHHENGAHIAGPNTRFGGLSLGTVRGEFSIDYRLASVPLMPGLYLITAAIFDEHMVHPYEYRDRAWPLRVQQGGTNERFGVIDLQGHWSISQASSVSADKTGEPRIDR